MGIAAYLTVSGLSVAFDGFSTTIVSVFVAIGVGCVLARAVLYVKRSDSRFPVRLLPVLGVGAVLVGVVLVFTLWRTANFGWNTSDDDAAYLYLVRRLTIVGNLLDPLNNRRLTSLGGASALQAMFLGRLPDTFLPLADALFGSLLILLSLWRTRLGRWSVWGIVAAFAVILFPFSLGGGINTSPIYLPVGLIIVIFAVAMKMRTDVTTRRGHVVCSAALGMLAWSVAVLRPQFAPPALLLALAAVAWPMRGSRVAARVAGMVVGSAAVVVPWAIASWRAVGTPLFPLFNGNADPSWLSGGPAVAKAPSLVDLTSSVAQLLFGTTRGIAFLLSAALAVSMYVWSRGRDPTDAVWAVRLWCVVALASLLVLVALADLWYAYGSPLTYPRFWAPAITASILIPLVALNARRTTSGGPIRLWSAAILGTVVVSTGATPVVAAQYLIRAATDTATGQVDQQLSRDRYTLERSDYTEAVALIPRGSKVLAAVDYPALLLESGLDVHTLDIIGSTSPSPHLPYFTGSATKLSWLRANGYTYVIAVDPSALPGLSPSIGLYNRAHWQENLRLGGQFGGWAPYFLDWFDFIQDMSHSGRPPLPTVAPLMLLKL
ncbi:MAG: hypothetical protein ABI323_07220 [Solirubrobacteraceae bacterium]